MEFTTENIKPTSMMIGQYWLLGKLYKTYLDVGSEPLEQDLKLSSGLYSLFHLADRKEPLSLPSNRGARLEENVFFYFIREA